MTVTAAITRNITCLNGAEASKPFQVNVIPNTKAEKDIQIANLRGATPIPIFISSVSISPIIGLPNFAKSIRRLTVERARTEINSVRVVTKGTRNPAQFRAQLSVDVVKFTGSDIAEHTGTGTGPGGGAKLLTIADAFGCHANTPDADAEFALPTLVNPQLKFAIGISYFFFVQRPTSGTITVTAGGLNRIIHEGTSLETSAVSKAADGALLTLRLVGKDKDNKVIWVAENVSTTPVAGLDWEIS